MDPRHSFEDHAAETRLVVEASSLAALFEEAARALAELVLEAGAGAADEPVKVVRLCAPDAAALLVDWLNELVYLSETEKRVYTDVRVTRATETELEATVRGVYPEIVRTAVKAATLHEVRVERGAHGYTASVVLDV
jgi:SHS2 domain-containing protein